MTLSHLNPTPISDPADPRVEPYLDIRERDLKGRGGRFVIEGEVVLRAALTLGRFAVESILVAENRLTSLTALVEGIPCPSPVYVANRAVLDRIAGFPLHRGLMAMGLRGEAADPAALLAGLPPKVLLLVASGIANHDNMGGLFRNAAAFGVDAVLLDAAACDPLYRKAIRVSAGAALVTPFAQGGDIGALVDLLKDHGFAIAATSPRGGRTLVDTHLTAIAPTGRFAVLFGAEGEGLPEPLLARLDTLRIDMAGGFDSLNVATTSGIVLHHFRCHID